MVVLHRREVAFVVIGGTDHPVGSATACGASFDRFVLRLPGIKQVFSVPAQAPNYVGRFPDCGPLGVSAVVAAEDVIASQRNPVRP